MIPNPYAPIVKSRDVRAKIFKDNRVALIMFETVLFEGREVVTKYSLNNEGAWQVLAEGQECLFIENVFVQDVEVE